MRLRRLVGHTFIYPRMSFFLAIVLKSTNYTCKDPYRFENTNIKTLDFKKFHCDFHPENTTHANNQIQLLYSATLIRYWLNFEKHKYISTDCLKWKGYSTTFGTTTR